MRKPALSWPLLALALLAPPATAEETRLTLLHTTDVHGSLLPWDDLLNKPAPRGLVKAATLVARVRAEGVPVLLFDAGDATAGSPLTTVWHRDPQGSPEPVTRAMNAIGYDAMAVGNHEFDFGPRALEATRAAAQFPFLALNVTRPGGGPAFAPSLVRVLPSGVRVGVLGLCTPAVPQLTDSSAWSGYVFGDPIEAARREVARLRGAEHCDVVVAIAHTGLEKDTRTGEPRRGDAEGENFGVRLATEVAGLDVVILGHTHVTVPFANVGGALVTQAGKWAEALGRVDLVLTRASATAPWAVTSKRAQVIAFGDSIPADTELAAALAPYAARTKAALDEVVASAPKPLAAPGGRNADNALWQAIHRAQLDATGAQVSLAALFDPAQSIPAGPVRVRDLMRLYPYDNSLVTVALTGAQLHEALEQSARTLAGYTFEDGRPLAEPGTSGFNFDMAAGVRYEIDLTAPAGSRVSALTRNGRPVAPGETLRVVVNGYRAAGGGGFAMIRNAPRVGRGAPSAPAALIAWARRTRVIAGAIEPSWTLLPDYAAAPERPLIDRLVRLGAVSRADVMRLRPWEPVNRSEIASGLGRAFAWLAPRPDGAAGADSASRWIAGARAHGVFGAAGAKVAFRPAARASVLDALNACEAAARAAHYALGSRRSGDVAFWRGLVTGLVLGGGTGRVGIPYAAPLDRAQWLGMVSNLRYPQVRVLETTDFHGAILGGTRERRSGRAIGGSVALASAIEHYRSENPEGTVLLDGGDWFQGTMISNLQYGRPVVEQMNLLGYTAAAIGNHDYDWSADTLQRRVAEMRFAALGANIVERQSGKRPAWVRSDTTVLRRGARVSIVGLAYPGTPRVTLPANVAHLRFADDSATAATVVPRLRQAGADVVLEVGHIPAETDSTRKARGDLMRLARGVPGVDVWFGGHSHNVVDDRVDDVSLLIAGSSGAWIAVADLTVDPVAHRVLERRTKVNQVFADEFPPDSGWIARVKRWNANVAPVAAEVIGHSSVALHRHRPEATIGDFITDAMRFVSGADIAMQNPGGMRAELPAGEISRGGIYEVMPFDNTIVTLSLTAADVKRSIEQSLAHDRVTQVSGIRFAFDMNQPAMARVTRLTLADGSALDDAKRYRVAVNNFMASGGDDYDVLKANSGTDTGLIIRGAMESYVRDRCKGGAALEIREDGRIEQAGR